MLCIAYLTNLFLDFSAFPLPFSIPPRWSEIFISWAVAHIETFRGNRRREISYCILPWLLRYPNYQRQIPLVGHCNLVQSWRWHFVAQYLHEYFSFWIFWPTESKVLLDHSPPQG